jgi:hypothetical protein
VPSSSSSSASSSSSSHPHHHPCSTKPLTGLTFCMSG